MKPCQVDLQNLVIQEKIYSVKDKSSRFIENQTEWKVYMHLLNKVLVIRQCRLLTLFVSISNYLQIAETKYILHIYISQAFPASILRPLHKVYEKMLNYIRLKCLRTKDGTT